MELITLLLGILLVVGFVAKELYRDYRASRSRKRAIVKALCDMKLDILYLETHGTTGWDDATVDLREKNKKVRAELVRWRPLPRNK
jgi:hypothetical protein